MHRRPSSNTQRFLRCSSVAFCIIFYLTCTAPSLWIIHVDTANRKLYRLAENKLNVRTRQVPSFNGSDKSQAGFHYVLRTSTPLVLSIGHIDCHDKVTACGRILDSLNRHVLII